MKSRQTPPGILLAGFGNSFRGDDAIGLEIARCLRGKVPANCSVVEVESDPLGVLDLWDGVDLAVMIDAVSSGAVPGLLQRYEPLNQPLPGGLTCASTHAVGPRELVELGRILGKLPMKLVLLGIEGRNFSTGAEMSPGCMTAVKPAVKAALEEIRCTNSLWLGTS